MAALALAHGATIAVACSSFEGAPAETPASDAAAETSPPANDAGGDAATADGARGCDVVVNTDFANGPVPPGFEREVEDGGSLARVDGGALEATSVGGAAASIYRKLPLTGDASIRLAYAIEAPPPDTYVEMGCWIGMHQGDTESTYLLVGVTPDSVRLDEYQVFPDGGESGAAEPLPLFPTGAGWHRVEVEVPSVASGARTATLIVDGAKLTYDFTLNGPTKLVHVQCGIGYMPDQTSVTKTVRVDDVRLEICPR